MRANFVGRLGGLGDHPDPSFRARRTDNRAADVGGADRYGLLRISCGGDCTWQRHQAGKYRQPCKYSGHEHGSPPGMEPALWPVFHCRHPCGPPQLPSQQQRNSRGQNSFRIDLAHQRRFAMPVTEMKDHVYKILELVGSSEKSIEDAIQNAITRASKTIREMKWFEVVQTRGHVEKGSVRHYQVTLRVGFTLEE
jgi:dodecin